MLTLTDFTRRYATRLWPWYLVGMLFLAATNLITLEIPQLAKVIVNGLGELATDDKMAQTALLIIGLGLLQILVRSLSRIMIFWPGRKLESDCKTDYFDRAMRLPQAFFLRFGAGDLVSRLSNDLGQLRVFYAFAVLQLFNMLFLLVFTITKMFSVHTTLAATCLLPVGLMVYVTRVVMPKLHKYSRLNQDALGRLTSKVTEAFVNVHVIQANAAQASFLKRIEVENEEVFTTNMKVIGIRTLFFPLLASLTNLAQLVVLFYGGFQVIAGKLSIGDILAFNIYLSYLAFPLMSVGFILSIYKRAKTALERVEAFDETKPETTVTAEPQPSAALLELRNLNFSFTAAGVADPDKAQGFQLKNINLRVQQGEKIGIFGPVGCGKSTLFNLITRLYPPPSGSIIWQSEDVLTYPPAKLRHDIGYALQAVHLFSDSIAENLQFGLADAASQDELEAAAKAAQIYDEILQFEDGWQTKIGEKGIRLSGGQKQRLALARLFLRHPKLYLLDDVLSAVDNRTESRLIEHIFHKEPQSTVILSSHRISALKHCDRVLVMHQGEVIDEGPFRELMERHKDLQEEGHAGNPA